MPSSVKFSLEMREPGAGLGKLQSQVHRPLHGTCSVTVKRAFKNRTAAFINCSNSKKRVMYC